MWMLIAGGPTPTPTLTPLPTHLPVPAGGAPVWLPILVGLGALLLGYAAGRLPRTARMEVSKPPGPGILPDLAGSAGADWTRAERGRSWRDQDQDFSSGRTCTDSASATERARLVASCADLADRLRERQPALYTVLTRDLEQVGVTVQLAEGEPFDAQRHNPVGTEPTADPAANLRVAATVRLGYRDHGAVVRVPDVIVYRRTEDGYGS